MHIDQQIPEQVLKWTTYAGAWFDDTGHYKEEIDLFTPSTKVTDALYILEQLGYRHWLVEHNGPLQVDCIIFIDEGKTCEKHPVDSQYVGSGPTIAMAICRAVLAAYDESQKG